MQRSPCQLQSSLGAGAEGRETGKAGGARAFKAQHGVHTGPTLINPPCPGSQDYTGIFKKTLEAIEYAECTELNEMRERHGTALYGVRLEAKGKEKRLKIGLEASGRPQRRKSLANIPGNNKNLAFNRALIGLWYI